MRITCAALIGVLTAAPAFAETAAAPATPPAPERITGTIAAFATPDLTVKTAKGAAVTVTLAPGAKVIANRKIGFSDIKPNDFISTTAEAAANGTLAAKDVRVFPEGLRGFGEGHYQAESPELSRTNATVVEAVADVKAKGGSLTLTFYGSLAGPNGMCSGHAAAPGQGACSGRTEIVVTPSTPVLQWLLGDTSWLEPGKAVSLYAMTMPDGKALTYGVIVERDGVKPLP